MAEIELRESKGKTPILGGFINSKREKIYFSDNYVSVIKSYSHY